MNILKNRIKSCQQTMVQGLGGLFLLGVSVSAWGVCVQSPTDAIHASPIVKTDGSQTCSDLSDDSGEPYIGCRIDKGNGECLVNDPNGNLLFTVTSSHDPVKGLGWSIVRADGVTRAVTAVDINGARGGNACVYLTANGATAGSGMGDYDATKEDFANVQFAEFCTDQSEVVVAADLPDCSEIGEELDGTGIDCAKLDPSDQRFLISLDPNSPNWNATACTCNVTFSDCNENATVEGGDNKCTGTNPLQALPVQWEAGNDGTWICRTIGGERQCWNR